MTVIWCCE